MQNNEKYLLPVWEYASKDYKLKQFLGKGTFGEVVYAKRKSDDREFAIKFLACNFKNKVCIRNYIREISILRQLTSFKCNFAAIRIHDVFVAKKEGEPLEEAKGIFLVTDYIPNDLKKMIHKIKPHNLTEMHIRVILYNMLCCLNYLHSANVMHRDLKPANVLIDDQC
jgi:mitogen-activated protein kinase 1/3